MSDPKIRRRTRSFAVTMSSVVANSTAIRFEDAAGAVVRIAAGVTATEFSTAVQLWASEAADGTYGRLYSDAGVAADLTIVRNSVTSTAYSLPDAAFSAAALKLVPQSTHLTSCTVIVKS